MTKITTFQEQGMKPNPAARILLRAITRKEVPTTLELPFDVQLIVNGVHLPFDEASDSLWKGWQDAACRDVESLAREKARQMVLDMGVARLTEALDKASELVSDAIETVANTDSAAGDRHAALSTAVGVNLREKWDAVFSSIGETEVANKSLYVALAEFDQAMRAALPFDTESLADVE